MKYINKTKVEQGCDLGLMAAREAVGDDTEASVCAFVKTLSRAVDTENISDATDFILGAVLTFAHFFNEAAEAEEDEELDMDMLKGLFGDLLGDLDKLGE